MLAADSLLLPLVSRLLVLELEVRILAGLT